MNDQRRENIDNVIKILDNVANKISLLQDEEQEYVDNMPENLQCSERCFIAESAVDSLEWAKESVEDATDFLNQAKGE